MICPILKSGTMIVSYEKTFSVGGGMGGSRHNTIQHESAECIGEQCEWFGHGCPAHPGTKEMMENFRATQ